MADRPIAPWGIALAGAAQLVFGIDDLLNGNQDIGMLLNFASGIMLFAAAWSLAHTLETGVAFPALAPAFAGVAFLRVADLSLSLTGAWDAQLAAFLLIVAGALVNTAAAILWRRRVAAAIGALRTGAALSALGALGYIAGALANGGETALWIAGAAIAAIGWGVVVARPRPSA